MKYTQKTDNRIPVTVLTGFLGSGKTTLLNRILTENHGRRIAVIENEFGEIGIDNALVVNADEEVFEMNNGCICCTVRGDLIRILGNLMKRRDRFDYVIVETTGLADPGPVAQTFFVDEEVREQFRLDGIVTLVDARHVWHHIDESDECREQIAFADKILINKTDLASEEEVVRLEKRLRSMNAMARVHRTLQAELPVSEVINIRAFDLDRKLEVDADFLVPELPFEWSGVFELPAGKTEWVFDAGPDPLMAMALFPVLETAPAMLEKAQGKAVQLFSSVAPLTIREGGLLVPGDRLQKVVFGDARTVLHLETPLPCLMAVYTQHMPEEFNMRVMSGSSVLTPMVSQEHSAGHTHDDTVGSVGLAMEGEIDPRRINEWLGEVLRNKGADIFRMKGILNLKGSANRFVFQGVHMLFDGKPDRPWNPGESRTNQLVFIGRELDRESLKAGFVRCLS